MTMFVPRRLIVWRHCCLMLVILIAAGCGSNERVIGDVDAHAPAALDLAQAGAVRVSAAPDLGFHFPYYLAWPAKLDGRGRHLLVIPNNTGTTDDDLERHDARVRRDVSGHGAELIGELGCPLLMPVFPRPAARDRIYTHALDRDVMTLPVDDPLARLDTQLLAMIDHARALLRAAGHEVDASLLMFGFSASGSFVDRFTALHPERVRAVAAGGVNALPILPLTQLEGRSLPYPVGVADLEVLTGRPFNRAAWQQVARLVFMGANDDNDTLPYGDAWNDDERALITAVLGEQMQPDRWARVQALLANEPGLTLRTYPGRGHEIDREIFQDVVEFLQAHTAAADVSR